MNANPATPTITAVGNTTICDGDSVELISSYGVGNTWSTAETTQNIMVYSAGDYAVSYVDGNGCSATSTITAITVNALPTVSAGADQTVCEGTSVTLSGSGALTYAWDNAVADGVPFTPGVGNVIYTVTGTDANGCENTDQVNVAVNPNPSISFSQVDTLCNNGSAVALLATPSGGTFSGAGISGDYFDPSAAGAGLHTLTYDYTDGNGCSGTSSVDVLVENCLVVQDLRDLTFEVYPNPTNNEVSVKFEGEFDFELTDAKGRLISKAAALNSVVIDLSKLESAVYFIRIEQNDFYVVERVVKY